MPQVLGFKPTSSHFVPAVQTSAVQDSPSPSQVAPAGKGVDSQPYLPSQESTVQGLLSLQVEVLHCGLGLVVSVESGVCASDLGVTESARASR
jgi:hypothetical protein